MKRSFFFLSIFILCGLGALPEMVQAAPKKTVKPKCPGKSLKSLESAAPPDDSQLPKIPTEEDAGRAESESVLKAVAEAFPEAKTFSKDDKLALTQTAKALKSKALVLISPAFKSGEHVKRVDLMIRQKETSPWTVANVTSSSDVKAPAIASLARDVYRLRADGVDVTRAEIHYLNREYRSGDDSQPLLKVSDVTEKVETQLSELGDKILEEKESNEKPEVAPLSIFHVPFLHFSTRRSLNQKGITDFQSLLARHTEKGILSKPLTEDQIEILKSAIEGKPFLTSVGMKKGFEEHGWDLTKPLVYLDFETISPAVPTFHGTKPHEDIPFQFGVIANGQPISYLHDQPGDPRPALVKALLEAVPEQGSVVAYYKEFETGVLERLAAEFPAHSEKLNGIIKRLVDPLPILQNSFYDPSQKGSYSLKKIAPAILGEEAGYSSLVIGNGLAAQRAYDVLINPKTAAKKRAALRQAMLYYCDKDSREVSRVVEWMLEKSGLNQSNQP